MLVCLHGSYLDHSYLKYSLAELKARYRLVYFDFRGSGRSERGSPQDWHTGSLAEDVLALLDALALDRVFLLAHSWGCHVAVKAALAQPERIAGNVFFDPAIMDFPRLYRNLERLSGSRAAVLARRIFEEKVFDDLEEYVALISAHFFQVAPEPGFLGDAIVSEAFFINTIDELRSIDLWGEICKLPMRTLVCNGAHDFYTRKTLSAEMQESLRKRRLTHIGVAAFERSGHFIMNDERTRALESVIGLVEACGEPAAEAAS